MAEIDIVPEIISKDNHNIFERFSVIKNSLSQIGIDLNSEGISLDVNEEEGIISYELNLSNVQFPNGKPDSFRMELKELAHTVFTKPTVTNLTEYRFQGKHSVDGKWSKKDFIAFDFEPFKIRYPKVHINAYKDRWGDHLSYPESTNLNILKMSCPLALKVFELYEKNIEDFPTNIHTNAHYVKLFEEVNEYGEYTSKVQ